MTAVRRRATSSPSGGRERDARCPAVQSHLRGQREHGHSGRASEHSCQAGTSGRQYGGHAKASEKYTGQKSPDVDDIYTRARETGGVEPEAGHTRSDEDRRPAPGAFSCSISRPPGQGGGKEVHSAQAEPPTGSSRCMEPRAERRRPSGANIRNDSRIDPSPRMRCATTTSG